MREQLGRRCVLVVAIASWAALSCDAPDGRPERPTSSANGSSAEPVTAPPAIDCERVTEDESPDGEARIHFARVMVGMSPEVCGAVHGPNDALAFSDFLTERLRAEPGCGACEIHRLDRVTLLDATLAVKGRWRSTPGGDRVFRTFMPGQFQPAGSPGVRLERASFYFMRGGEAFEGGYEGLCPGSPFDPDAPGPRVVSEACLRFSESPAPWTRPSGSERRR